MGETNCSKKCGLEEVDRNGKVQCRAICPKYNPSKRCCMYCIKNWRCKDLCGWMRKEMNKKEK